MCSMKTEAMKSRLITSTGTGPLHHTQKEREKEKKMHELISSTNNGKKAPFARSLNRVLVKRLLY